MTLAQLRAFALPAVDDDDARIVLEDAFRELDSIVGFHTTPSAIYLWFYEDDEARMTAIQLDPTPGLPPRFVSETAHEWLAHALAAAMLFGAWPESWPFVEQYRWFEEDWL